MQKSLYSHFQFITVKGSKVKLTKEKGTWGKAQRKLNANFQEFFPVGSSRTLLIPPTSCDHPCEVLPSREAHYRLSAVSLYCEMVIQHPLDQHCQTPQKESSRFCINRMAYTNSSGTMNYSYQLGKVLYQYRKPLLAKFQALALQTGLSNRQALLGSISSCPKAQNLDQKQGG